MDAIQIRNDLMEKHNLNINSKVTPFHIKKLVEEQLNAKRSTQNPMHSRKRRLEEDHKDEHKEKTFKYNNQWWYEKYMQEKK